MHKTSMVRLTDDERHELVQLTKSGKAAASKIKHAHILLHVDANGPNWSAAHVAKALHWHSHTVRNVRQRFVAQGLEAALVRQKQVQPSRQCLLDGAKEAPWMALRCGPPPQGQAKWTLQVLAEQLVALNVVETSSYETVRQTLKKTSSSRTGPSAGGCPRSTMPTVWPTGKRSWLSRRAPMIHGTRWSTWMQSRCR
jgi:hypothetical protein